jgi:hypothetical protein
VQTGELKNIINELLGIQFNIEKARLDGKVQNLAAYINETTLIASHEGMDGKKAKDNDFATSVIFALSGPKRR